MCTHEQSYTIALESVQALDRSLLEATAEAAIERSMYIGGTVDRVLAEGGPANASRASLDALAHRAVEGGYYVGLHVAHALGINDY